MKSPPESHRSRNKTWLNLFRWAVAGSVLVAIVYTGITTMDQLRESEFRFSGVQWGHWMLAVLVYMITMLFSWSFWHRVLKALNQPVRASRSMLAFFASQLGKYVPGKAMVVVIRTDMIRGDRIQTSTAAASVFVETLTWLFIGAAIGCLLLVFQFRDQEALLASAFMMTAIAGGLTAPPVFRRIATRLGVGRATESDGSTGLSGLNWSTMGFGWLVMSIGWLFNGASLWLVLAGMPNLEVSISDYPLTLACVTLATVAGFVSLLPGGLGVRELVIIPLLGTRYDMVTAVVAAIVIRLVWLSAELVSSGIILLWNRKFKPET